MRLPTGKVYRAFPELDRFTDEQCESFIAQARRHHTLSQLLVMLVALAGSCVVAGTVLAGLYWIADLITRTQVWPWIQRQQIDLLYRPVAILVVTAAWAVTIFAVRDVWLRWAVRKELVRSTCPKCEYLLIGLSVSDGSITCPECGSKLPQDIVRVGAAES